MTAESPNQPNVGSDVVYLSRSDEIANVSTHALGIVLSLFAAVFFWNATQSLGAGLRVTCLVFAISMVAVYLFSTLSHAVHAPRTRNRLRAWDQGTIYLLIAGTYSPFIWQGSPTGMRTIILSLVWLAAAFGFYSKVLSSYRVNAVSTVTYVLLGWLPALPLIRNTPWICFLWMLLGGLSFTLGIAFLVRSSTTKYAHAAWHVMVMLGSACHCIAIDQLLRIAAA